jgi:hypothetical protein
MSARDSVLWSAAVAHGVLAIAFAVILLTRDLPLIGGAHPALKPLKFAVSLMLLLGSLAYVMPAIELGCITRTALTSTLLTAVIVEMLIISVQAFRGVPSHFNTSTALDARLFHIMGLAAAVIALSVLTVAVLALVRPLALSPLVGLAVRVGLLLVFLTAISGFLMGGRGSHTLGAADLRVPHFFALHGLQALPLAALLVERMPLGERGRFVAMITIAAGWVALAVGTLVRALAGRGFPL